MITDERIIMVPIAQMLDRQIPLHDEMWDELIDTHMFKGNDTWLPLAWYEDTKLYDFVEQEVRNEILDPDMDSVMLEVTW